MQETFIEYPGLVHNKKDEMNKDGTPNIKADYNYETLLLRAIQELKDHIDILYKRIEVLENK